MKISAGRIVFGVVFFLVITVVFGNLPSDVAEVVLPIVLIAVFLQAVVKSPPVAIAVLLYYSMVLGGWFILAAAPVTMLLARRYQRQRLQVELNPVHIRRTVLLAMAALVATLPFIGASLGAWSSRSQFSATRSAEPLIGDSSQGEQGMLQRFARWLGFGDDVPGDIGPLRPTPVQPQQTPPDDPFNWWIVVAIVAVIALAVLAWWLWRRRTPRIAPSYRPAAAQPLARLEAIGELVGRPRQPSEGAITYGHALARRTGDARLSAAGPLVSSAVYESAFVNPAVVHTNLAGIESAPPPAPPRPSFGARMSARLTRIPLTPRGLAYAAVGVLAFTLLAWLVAPYLGELDSDRFSSNFGLLPIS